MNQEKELWVTPGGLDSVYRNLRKSLLNYLAYERFQNQGGKKIPAQTRKALLRRVKDMRDVLDILIEDLSEEAKGK